MTATIIPLAPRPKYQPVNLRLITLLQAAHDNAGHVAEFADDAREAHLAGRCFVDRPGMLDPATLLAYNPATGGAREDLDAETEIENFEVGFNGVQMLNVLREVEAKYVRIYLGEGQMRALKICPTGATDTFVVVPMIPKAMPEEI